MTVSEKIINDYIKQGKTLEDVPPELKGRLNANSIAKLYKTLVEDKVIDPVEIDEVEASPEDKEPQEEEELEDDAEESKPSDKNEEPQKKKTKFEDVWQYGKKK